MQTPDRRAEPEPPADPYHELCARTLELGDAAFLHQHVVDTHTAQVADEHTKPIAVTFALVGLHLYLEENVSGRQVQRVHMLLARRRRQWPRFVLPPTRTSITARDALTAAPGEARERAIREWARAVWADWSASHDAVRELLKSELAG